jgi:hypothetical protein
MKITILTIALLVSTLSFGQVTTSSGIGITDLSPYNGRVYVVEQVRKWTGMNVTYDKHYEAVDVFRKTYTPNATESGLGEQFLCIVGGHVYGSDFRGYNIWDYPDFKLPRDGLVFVKLDDEGNPYVFRYTKGDYELMINVTKDSYHTSEILEFIGN